MKPDSHDDGPRDGLGRWRPGKSGNPAGRTAGLAWAKETRLQLRAAVPDVLMSLYRGALQGDARSAALLLERVLPALRAGDDPVSLLSDPAASLADQARGILAEVTAGRLSPAQGADLLAALGSVARIIDATETESRLQALEDAAAAGRQG